MATDLFRAVEDALLCDDVVEKRALVAALPHKPSSQQVQGNAQVMAGGLQPGRPQKPELVHPARVQRRRLSSLNGRIALIHAIAHIEFNAINLALDAIWRFRGMPVEYYADWLIVAHDESRHFGWLEARLQSLGSSYGALPAHDGLWEAAVKTAHDPLARMALVPRVLEARGLDVTPGMIERLRAIDDHETVAILEQILAEEVAHVEAGSRWYRYLCAQLQLDAEQLFPQLLQKYLQSLPRGPFNHVARAAAGFSKTELQWLRSLSLSA